jgi:hypothetical protein
MSSGKSVIVVLLSLLAACEAAPTPLAPTDAELAASACEDYHQAHLAMCSRCGIQPPRPAGSPGAAWKYSDCADVRRVKDVAALYDTCLPALETGCFEGDMPAATACHQFEF